MYAIVKTGGKQYRVERGQRLLVERLPAAEGESVALEPILYRSDEAVFDKTGLAKVKVTAKVIAHERGEKLRVFKFKPKRGYKRRTGHRQELTRIEVTELAIGAGSRAKAAKDTEAPAQASAAPAAAKPAGEKKAAPTKASSAAKPAASKPASAKAAGAKPADDKGAGAAKPAAAKPAAAKKAPAKPKKAVSKETDDGS
ncbi:MAG TPA: 50S ribosomal protein L21 [Solirubrobacteraceae bacterium]